MLVDASAWVEYLRATGSAVHLHVREALAGSELLTTDPVVMEVLAGARDDREVDSLSALLARARAVPCVSADYLSAAELYRAAARQGTRVRNSLDCLIAAVALREDVPVLHADRDFETLALVSGLQLVGR
jgi:predicted nucleic acid-binding protein